jgi:hypothetical protein
MGNIEFGKWMFYGMRKRKDLFPDNGFNPRVTIADRHYFHFAWRFYICESVEPVQSLPTSTHDDINDMGERNCGNCIKEDECASWDMSYGNCLSQGIALWEGRYKCPKVPDMCGFNYKGDCALNGPCTLQIDKKTIIPNDRIERLKRVKEIFK